MSLFQFQHQPANAALLGRVIANTTSAATSIKENLIATTAPGVGNDNTQGYAVGSVWLNTSTNSWYDCASASTGAAVWNARGSSGGTSLGETISYSNSFSVGNVVSKTSGGYALALADSASDAEALGLVTAATSGNFTIVYQGKATWTSHGFAIGAVLFLSPTTNGGLQTTEPSTAGQISKPVAIALDANTLLILNMRGYVVPSAAQPLYPKKAFIQEQQTQGTAPGYSLSSGNKVVRHLNTLVSDINSLITTVPSSGNSYCFTAVSGTYQIFGWAGISSNAGSTTKLILYNSTQGTNLVFGCRADSPNAGDNENVALIDGVFTSNGSDLLCLQHYCNDGGNGTNPGASIGVGTEIYSSIWIEKIA